jgi:tetratricopeptide (TPR) repeat protein
LRRDVWVCLLLVLAILVIYGQVSDHDFINFDDDVYIASNRWVPAGLSAKGMIWAFSFKDKRQTYWHPLTWLSHMLDAQLYGLDAGRHHLTNVLFHMVNTLLLFMWLHRMTGAIWRSAFVAGLFAVHPLNVESVAWLAERKNVLSTFFWMLTLLIYARYSDRPGLARYFAVLVVYALGLLAKPMLVTLPFVLLLLDYWPLNRFGLQKSGGVHKHLKSYLILEKIPLLGLSGLAVYLSSVSLQGIGNYISLQSVPITLRIQNALLAYTQYFAKMLWPQKLAVFYPYPEMVPLWQIIGASIFLMGVTIFVILTLKQYPYLAVGWLWYLGTLIPVSGIVQAGLWPAMADRWTYIPLIGLFMSLVWGVSDLGIKCKLTAARYALVPLMCIVGLGVASHLHVRIWANSLKLFDHALKVTKNNYVAHNNLGRAMAALGRDSEAFEHYSAALRINPHSAHAHVNIGSALLARGGIETAINHFQHALRIKPDFAEALNNIGLALIRTGKIVDAIDHFQLALKKDPDFANGHKNLRLALRIKRRIEGAAERLQASLDLDSEPLNVHLKLAQLSKNKQELIEAVSQYQKALSKQPGISPLAMNDIASGAKIMQAYDGLLPLLLKIITRQPENADAYYHVACIYSRQGKRKDAIQWLNKAVDHGFIRWDLLRGDPDLAHITSSEVYHLHEKMQKSLATFF